MNTDKLMELERKWRAEAAELSTQAGREFRRGNYESQLELAQAAQDASSRADELAAALRAEQAVGDEQRAHIETLRAVRSVFEGIPAPCAERDAIDAAIRALGTARQSEWVVVVPREPTEAMFAAALPLHQRMGQFKLTMIWNAMLAAAPGGEGEG